MDGDKRARKVFRSRMQFEREYFPQSFAKKMAGKTGEPRALGAALARQSLDKVKKALGAQES